MGTPLGPKYIPYTYMDLLGLLRVYALCCLLGSGFAIPPGVQSMAVSSNCLLCC